MSCMSLSHIDFLSYAMCQALCHLRDYAYVLPHLSLKSVLLIPKNPRGLTLSVRSRSDPFPESSGTVKTLYSTLSAHILLHGSVFIGLDSVPFILTVASPVAFSYHST